MLDTIKVERTASAPRPSNTRTRRSKWRVLLHSLKVGDWFVVDKKYRARVRNAGQLYLRGKYSMYMHPKSEGQYIFLRNR